MHVPYPLHEIDNAEMSEYLDNWVAASTRAHQYLSRLNPKSRVENRDKGIKFLGMPLCYRITARFKGIRTVIAPLETVQVVYNLEHFTAGVLYKQYKSAELSLHIGNHRIMFFKPSSAEDKSNADKEYMFRQDIPEVWTAINVMFGEAEVVRPPLRPPALSSVSKLKASKNAKRVSKCARTRTSAGNITVLMLVEAVENKITPSVMQEFLSFQSKMSEEINVLLHILAQLSQNDDDEDNDEDDEDNSEHDSSSDGSDVHMRKGTLSEKRTLRSYLSQQNLDLHIILEGISFKLLSTRRKDAAIARPWFELKSGNVHCALGKKP